MKNRKILFFLCVLIPLAVGSIAALITRDGMRIYQVMEMPFLAPPAWLFPIVWTLLYFVYVSPDNLEY